jgi:hypothetical protein
MVKTVNLAYFLHRHQSQLLKVKLPEFNEMHKLSARTFARAHFYDRILGLRLIS